MADATTRSEGTTPSERYLASLAKRSFLNLWSWPNLYRNQKQHGKGDGKELCDLLVVCGDHILIFSDKTVKFPRHSDTGIAWSRWYRAAVDKSVKQIAGAERWISQNPERIFLDKECTKPFPIELPRPNSRKVHGIVVALGTGEACRKYFNGGTGSLIVRPSVLGRQHMEMRVAEFEPFAVGDVNPNGSFIHVLDDSTLDIVMREFDTVPDFAHYLEKKTAFVRSGRLLYSDGEENLVAYYAVRMNADNEHDFTPPESDEWSEDEQIILDGNHYDSFTNNPQYIAKKKADEVSYIWDRLINAFTTNMLAGTNVIPAGTSYSLTDHERAVRYMALETRFRRRSHGEAILGALEEGKKGHRFLRAMIPSPSSEQNTTGFFFLTFEYLPLFKENGGYDEYRKVRSFHLKAYALGILRRHKYLRRVVGVATEPPNSQHGASEDLILFEPDEWTPELEAEAEELCKGLGIMQENRLHERSLQGNEFPEVVSISRLYSPHSLSAMNRKQRRKLRVKLRKQEKHI